MAGGLPVRENKFVEQWAHLRENVEYKFKWTPKTMRTFLLAGIVAPVLIYRMTVKEFVRVVAKERERRCRLGMQQAQVSKPRKFPVLPRE